MLAFVSNASGRSASVTANAGWTEKVTETAGAVVWGGVFWKYAGPGESATQQPITSGSTARTFISPRFRTRQAHSRTRA